MKTILFSFFILGLISCGLVDDEQTVVLANYPLKDGAEVYLQIKNSSFLGATTPNVTWIYKKELSGHKVQIGKINDFLDRGKISFKGINDSMVNLIFTDSIWHHPVVYTIHVKHSIYPNDGSPYLKPQPLHQY